MMQDAAGGLRFTLDLPSPHEPRRFKVRPVAGSDPSGSGRSNKGCWECMAGAVTTYMDPTSMRR